MKKVLLIEIPLHNNSRVKYRIYKEYTDAEKNKLVNSGYFDFGTMDYEKFKKKNNIHITVEKKFI